MDASHILQLPATLFNNHLMYGRRIIGAVSETLVVSPLLATTACYTALYMNISTPQDQQQQVTD